jgi:hypothetical protein
MLHKSLVSTRLACLASAFSLFLNLPTVAYPQQPPPQPPPEAPAPAPAQAQPKDEKTPQTIQAEPEGEAAPESQEAKEPVPKGATLKGKVTGSDRSTPVAGARVHAIAKDQKVYSSGPADAKGRYNLSGIPPGTYRIAVSTEEGVFTLESDIGISSANTYTVNLATIQAEAARGMIPGMDLEPRGFAAMIQGKTAAGGPSFWGSAKGITLLAISAGAIALILSQSDNGGESTPVSPSSP